MRVDVFGLALTALAFAGLRRPAAAEDSRRHPKFRRGDGQRRHRQRLCRRVGIHGRRRRRHLRLQRRRLRRHAAGRRRVARQVLPQRQHARRRVAVSRRETSGLELDKRDRRLSARHRQRRHHRSGAAARRRERRDARPRRLPFRARQRGLGLRRRRCLVDGLRRHLGTRRRLADARHRQLHRPPRGDVAVGLLHRQLAAPAAWPTARASAASPRRWR